MKIAQLQLPVFEDKSDTLEYVEKNIQKVSDADFVTLPEMFCCPYEAKNFPAYAEYEKGEVWQACSLMAKKYGVYLSAETVMGKYLIQPMCLTEMAVKLQNIVNHICLILTLRVDRAFMNLIHLQPVTV